MEPETIELCRRYRDILRARGNSERTIDNYLYSLRGFAGFLGERPLANAGVDDIVAYQIQIAASGRSDSCVRVATYALRGFLERVLERDDAKLAKLPRPRRPKRLPEVLGRDRLPARRSARSTLPRSPASNNRILRTTQLGLSRG